MFPFGWMAGWLAGGTERETQSEKKKERERKKGRRATGSHRGAAGGGGGADSRMPGPAPLVVNPTVANANDANGALPPANLRGARGKGLAGTAIAPEVAPAGEAAARERQREREREGEEREQEPDEENEKAVGKPGVLPPGVTEPLEVGSRVKCLWRDNSYKNVRIVESRKRYNTNLNLNLPSDQQSREWEYYVHFVDFNRRLDTWYAPSFSSFFSRSESLARSGAHQMLMEM